MVTGPSHPDLLAVDALAEHLGVGVDSVVAACGVLGIEVEPGVHRSYIESVRQVIVQWIREGKA